MKIKQFLKRIVAATLAATTMLTSFSIEAFAGYDGTGTGSQGYTYGTLPGMRDGRWGYRFALVDAKTGKVQKGSDGEYLVRDWVQIEKGSSDAILMENAYTLNTVRTDKTDLGYIEKKYGFYSSQPAPVESDDKGNWIGKGEAIKTWLTDPEGCLLKNGKKTDWLSYIVKDFFGEDSNNKVIKGQYKLVLEPTYLIPLYSDYVTGEAAKDVYGNGNYSEIVEKKNGEVVSRKYSSYSGVYFYGTYAESIQALYDLSSGSVPGAKIIAVAGGGGYQSLAVRITAKCMYIEEKEFNLTPPTDFSNDYIAWIRQIGGGYNHALGNLGYGIHIYGVENAPINTYDVDKNPDKPALAEKPTEEKSNTGNVTIYKVYGQVRRDPSTNKAVDIENISEFIREDCTNSIIIEDEEDKSGYKVVAWTADTHAYTAWKYTSGSNKGQVYPFKANKWAQVDDNGRIYFETSRNDSQVGQTYGQFYMASDSRPAVKSNGAELTYDMNNPLKLNSKNKTLYVLYLKDADKISTLGDPAPTPNTYEPEDPTGIPSKQGEFSIVKVYGKRNTTTGAITHVTTTSQKNTTYLVNIIDEPYYKIKEWHVVDSKPDTNYKATEWWGESGSKFNKTTIKQSGLNLYNGYNETIYCKTGISSSKKGTLYVLYLLDDTPPAPVETEVDISESYIAKRFMLGSMEDSSGRKYKDHVFKWDMPVFDVPGSHDGISSWPDSKLKFQIDQTETLTEDMGILTNWTDITKYGNPRVPNLTYRKKFEITSGVSSCKEKSAKTWELKNLEFYMVLYRLDDKPNLFKTNITGDTVKNTNASTLITQSKNTFKLDKTSSNRQDNGEYNFSFNLVFDESSKNDYSRTCKCYDYYYEWIGEHRVRRREYTNETNETTFDTSTRLDITQKVTYAVYAGKDNTVKSDVGNPDTPLNTYDHGNTSEAGVTMNVGSISFRPYIRMQYDTEKLDNKEVYVTGERQRELFFNEYVGVSFEPNKNDHSIVSQSFANVKGKITISSNQWSNHATANAAVGKNDCVLPGGATLDAMIMKNDRQIVKVTGFFPVITGTGLKQVTETGGSNNGIPTDTTQAEQEFEQFVQTVEHSIETWNIAQWVTEDTVVKGDTQLTNISKPVWKMSSLHPTKVSADDGKFGNAADESKYYFRSDNDYGPIPSTGVEHEDANTGDLDTTRESSEKKYYTFYTDTLGNIYVKVADSLSSASNLTRLADTGSSGKLLVSRTNSKNDLNNLPAFYKDLDKKTGVITKLYYGLESCRDTSGVCDEQCTAKDSSAKWVNDGKWYNEAFDGITVAFFSTTLKVGFTKPGTRTSVLDPKLVGSSASKSDLLTNYRLSQFRMDDHSEFYGTVGKIGEFRGEDVIVNGMEDLFISDIFYIPNATVQDLR